MTDAELKNYLLELPGKYRIDLEAANVYHQGAMINIKDPSMVFWSRKVPKAYSKITHNVKEIKSSQVSEIKSQYRSLLERSILNAGGRLKFQD